MPVIENIEINRFQAHKSSSMNLHPNVNVILGSSDVGKSSIIRALNWVITNRPSGDSFMTNTGKGETSVAVELSSEQYVVRTKGGKTNEYDADGKTLKALRADVPEEVTEILNMAEVNIQPQHEMYFLLGDTPGQVAKSFNQVAGLEEMDVALKKANAISRELTGELNYLTQDVQRLEDELEKSSWVEKASEALSELQEQQENLYAMYALRNSTQQALLEIAEVTSEIESLPPKQMLCDINSIFVGKKALDSEIDEYNKIEGLLNSLSAVEKDIKHSNPYVDVDLSNTEEMCAEYDRLQSKAIAISKALDNYEYSESKIEELALTISDLKKEEESIMAECKICPECGQPIMGEL